jgi:hypothetical protein
VEVPKNQLAGPLSIEALFDSGPLQGKLASTTRLDLSAGPR